MRKLPRNLTGLDLLIMCSYEDGGLVPTPDLDHDAARVFQQLCMDVAGGVADDLDLAEILGRPHSVAEDTATRILGAAIQVARARGTEEQVKEVIGVGVSLAMRFSEYAETFLPGDAERERQRYEAREQWQRIQRERDGS